MEKYKLNKKISFGENKLGQRIFQESVDVTKNGYKAISSCLSYVHDSTKYNAATFISGGSDHVYVNAYAATNEQCNDTLELGVTVTFISNEYFKDLYNAVSDEPEDDISILQESEAEQGFPHVEE